jgi:hypothetical protein
MEKSRSRITASAESATFLYAQNTRKGHTGRLASLASHKWQYLNGHGKRDYSTWAEQKP